VQWIEYDSGACSASRALEILGDRWTMLVLREVFNGVRRFDEISSHLGVARDVLTRRLANLVDEGVLTRMPYQEKGARTRYEYRLTQAGRDLRPILLALIEWGDRHRAGDDGVPVHVVHRDCGAPVHLSLTCEAGHQLPIDARLQNVPGPGARLAGPSTGRARPSSVAGASSLAGAS
jgi:DNA-binding HxlR family transcriptional regulator